MAKSKTSPKEKAAPIKSNGVVSVDAEVIPPVEEQEEIIIPVKDQLLNLLSADIARFDKYEARISEIREKCSHLTIAGIDDKEGYENVRLAISYCRKIRTGTLADKKVAKSPLISAGKSIEDRSNWIIAQVTAIEEPLQARKDEIDAEAEKAKELKRQAKAAKLSERMRELQGLGAQTDGTLLYLGEVSYKLSFISDLDDDVYEGKVLPKYKEIFDANEAIRLQKEEDERIQKQKLKDQQDELDRQQKELEKQREDFRQQQLADQKKKDEEAAEQRRLKAEAEKNLFNGRLAELKNIDYNGKYAFMKGFPDNALVSYQSFIGWDNDTWNNFRDAHNKVAEDILADLKDQEDKRLAKIKQDAIAEGIRIQKEKQDQDLKDKKEREERELEEASDKKKWEAVYEHLRSCPLPEMKSPKMKAKMEKVKNFLANL